MTKKQKRKNNKKSYINIHELPFIGFKFCLTIGEDETDILCDGYSIDKNYYQIFMAIVQLDVAL